MTEQSRSTGGLLGDALTHISALVRNEVDLARAELNENANRAAMALGLIGCAVIAAITALNVMAAALVAALTEWGLGAGWSALIVGVAFAVVAAAMLSKGTNDLKLSSLAPARTGRNVARDARAVKESTDGR
jgi:hypothetical protein